jgi:hypothetical protein
MGADRRKTAVMLRDLERIRAMLDWAAKLAPFMQVDAGKTGILREDMSLGPRLDLRG